MCKEKFGFVDFILPFFHFEKVMVYFQLVGLCLNLEFVSNCFFHFSVSIPFHETFAISNVFRLNVCEIY